MTKPMLSDAEIRRRKKTQATTSRVGGALGLAALGATGLATRPGQKVMRAGFKRVNKPVPQALRSKPKAPGLDKTIQPMLATSAGIGALGAFNFARYTEAESRKRKSTMAKRSPFEDGYYGAIGKRADPEESRMKRARAYEATAGAAGGVMAVESGIQGFKAGRKLKRLPKNDVTNVGFNTKASRFVAQKDTYKAVPTRSIASAARSGRNAALLAGGSAAAFTASNKIRDKRKGGSWSPYAG